MKSIILRVFNARPEEFTSVGLMLLLGFFMGIFLATYDVVAPALFLSEFGGGTVLAQAILISALLSVLSTYLYAYLQRTIGYKNLVFLFLLTTLAATIQIWDQSVTEGANKVVVFIGFVLVLPFSFTANLIFWGYFGRIFDLKQSKRIIGAIDSGQLIASIISLFVIGYCLDTNILVTHELYIGSAIGIVGMIAVAALINPLVKKSAFSDKKVKSQTYRKIFSNPYTRWMTSFVIIGLIAITFIEYSFLTVTDMKWETVAEKGVFLAQFEATVIVFSFLFQTFITDWLIENYGLRTSLLINPILAILLATIALLIGFLVDYSVEGSSFVWFFLAIAATKLFIETLKNALDSPTFKLYFLPIEKDLRFDITTKIEGVITAIGAVIAGLLLLIMTVLGVALIYVVAGLIFMLFIWIIVANRMHSGYKFTIQHILKSNKEQSSSDNNDELTGKLTDLQVINALKLKEHINPGEFEEVALTMIDKAKGNVLNFLDKKIKKMELSFNPTTPTTKKTKELASLAINQAESNDVISVAPDRLYTLAKSHNKEDKILATKLLRKQTSDKSIFALIELLRDSNVEVKKQAIITARKVKRKETWPILIDLLSNKIFSYEASSALIGGGKQVLTSLENAFHKSGQTQSVMLKIISIVTKIEDPEAYSILWRKIDFPDRKIARHALLSYKEKEFNASEKETIHLNDILLNEMNKLVWNIAAIDELSNKPYNDLLKKALNDEVENNFSMIYIILSMLYDSVSIELVKKNIELDTIEGNAFALELLDIFIDQDLKPKLFPILDDLDTKEKIAKLKHFFPRQPYDETTTYNFLLNRDYDSINRWTKACTLYALKFNKKKEVKNSVIAHMFNPDNLLSELATSIVKEGEDKTKFDSLVERLVLKDSKFKLILERLEDNQLTNFDMFHVLHKGAAFQFLSGLHISQIIDRSELIELTNKEELIITDEQFAYYVLEGSPTVSTKDEKKSVFLTCELVGNMFLDEKIVLKKIVSEGNTRLYKIRLNDIFDILTNYKNLSSRLINVVSKNLLEHFK